MYFNAVCTYLHVQNACTVMHFNAVCRYCICKLPLQLAYLHIVRTFEIILHDTPTRWSPGHVARQLSTKVFMGSKCHRFNIVSMCEPALLLLAVPTALETCASKIYGKDRQTSSPCVRRWSSR